MSKDATPPTRTASGSTERGRLPIDVVLLMLVYFFSARIALLFAFEKTNASVFWPPAGIALAAFAIIDARRAWIGVALGAFLANLLTFIGNGFTAPLPTTALSLIIALGNATAGLVAWTIAGRPRVATGIAVDGRNGVRWILSMMVAAGGSALVGTTAVVIGTHLPAALWTTIFRVWSLGDAAGILIATPLLVVWWCPEPADERRRVWVPYVLLCGLMLVQQVLSPPSAWPLMAILGVPFVAIGCRSRRAARATLAIAAVVLVWKTVSGYGPLAVADVSSALLRLQIVLLGLAVLVLVIDIRVLKGRLHQAGDEGIGLLLRGQRGPANASLLPALVVIAVGATFSTVTWYSLLRADERAMTQATTQAAREAADRFSDRLEDLRRTVARQSARWDDEGGLSEDLWRRDAARHVADFPFLEAIEWADADTFVRWIEPLAGNESVLGLQLSADASRRSALEAARTSPRPVFTKMVSLKQGGTGFLLYSAMRPRGERGGYLIGVVRLSRLAHYLQGDCREWDPELYDISVIEDGRVVFTTRPNDAAMPAGARRSTTGSLGRPLDIELSQRRPPASKGALLARIALNVGLLLSTLIGASIALVGLALDQAKRAQNASRSKERFLATMSHEIRTPMNGILGAIDLALGRTTDRETRGHLELVEQSGRALLAILNDILDFSKIESGRMLIERIPFDLRELLRQAVALLATSARSRQVALSLVLDDLLPSRVVGDPVRVRQVLLNILSNAVKFTQNGTVAVEAQVRGGTFDRPIVRLTCTDSGIGMDETALAGLFTPFMQADASTTRRFGGTGLGLAIVSRLVSAMGGTVRADSRVGRGTVFTIDLPFEAVAGDSDDGHRISLEETLILPAAIAPIAAAPPIVATLEIAPPPAANRVPDENALRVLLAEDNLVNQKVAAALLERCGCRVDTVGDGAAAIERLAAASYDLVLMDVQMPVLDGIEACRRIRASETPAHHTPIVALTANAFDEDRDACLAAGMDAFVTKPLRGSDIKGLVEKYASGPRKAPEKIESAPGVAPRA